MTKKMNTFTIKRERNVRFRLIPVPINVSDVSDVRILLKRVLKMNIPISISKKF